MTRAILLLLAITPAALADDWPNWMGPGRDNVWRETGIVDRFPVIGPKVAWRVSVAGGYSGPAVAKGRVYVGDYLSDVDPKREVYERTDHKGTERLLCFDEKSGKLLWKHEYPCRYTISFPNGPRTTPCVHDGRVYFLGAEGNLSCVDALTGQPIWAKDYKLDFKAKTPIWGFASHPVIEGDRLFCVPGGDGCCVVALDRKTGKELWRKLTAAEPGYSTPMLIDAAGKRQLLVWHAESVNSLDPATGERLWSVPLAASNGSAIMVPIVHGEYLFVGGFSYVCKGMKLRKDKPGADVLWTGNRKTGLYPVNSQPFADEGLIYGVCQNGELRCVELATGQRLWETLEPVGGKAGQCQTAFLIKNGDRFWLFNERGELIVAKISRNGYEEISRAKVIETTGNAFGRDLVYCAPAFANQRLYVRNDKELIAIELAK